MKKKLSLLLILILVFTVVFTGCGKEKIDYVTLPYDDIDLSSYVTLPDYNAYKYSVPVYEITEEDLDNKIIEVLSTYAKTVTTTEGVCEKGDKLVIDFVGTLEDGSKPSTMAATSHELTLGNGGYITGFEEAIYGAKVGSTVIANCQFPENYQYNQDYSGKKCTFEITIVSKEVQEVYEELNDEFCKANTKYNTAEEMLVDIKAELKEEKQEENITNLKDEIIQRILEEGVVLKEDNDRVNMYVEIMDKIYKTYAELYSLTFEDFLSQYLEMTEQEFKAWARESATEAMKQDLIMFALGQKEEIKITKSTMDEYREYLINYMGATSEEDFADYYGGLTIDDYMTYIGIDKGIIAEEISNKIYDNCAK